MGDYSVPLRVYLDVPVTRRMRVHAVVDSDGAHVYHARRVSEVFDWLIEVGVDFCDFADEDHTFTVHFHRHPSP